MIILCWSLILIIFILCITYKKRQSNNKIGGEIAYSKSFWLGYTLINWFFLPIILTTSSYAFSSNLLFILSILTFSMWIRGIIELFMLFRFKNWNPIYGITHSFFTFIICLIAFVNNFELKPFEYVYVISLLASLLFETYYAYFFYKNVGLKTQGEKGIWYANSKDPIFKKNLRITFVGNILCYSCLFYFLINLN